MLFDHLSSFCEFGLLHDLIVAEAVQLEDKHDLFLDSNDNPLGCFAWKHWLFYCKGN